MQIYHILPLRFRGNKSISGETEKNAGEMTLRAGHKIYLV